MLPTSKMVKWPSKFRITDDEITKMFEYKLNVSEATDFIVPVIVANKRCAWCIPSIIPRYSKERKQLVKKTGEIGKTDS